MPTQVRMMHYSGTSAPEDMWKITHDILPELEEGEVQLRLDWISIDPGMRGWTTNKRSYMPPVTPGDIMRSFGVGEVLCSRSDAFVPGDFVTGFTGVQSEAVLKAQGLSKVDVNLAPAHHYMSGLGWTGYTAYFGMMDIGQPKAGQTVVVSAASGAVGSIAAQLARNEGAHVIGIAGGPEKTAYLRDTLKLAGVIDYKNENIDEALRREAPNGIDLYFDNVGGETLDAVFRQINYKGTIVVCGGISQYGDMHAAEGPSEYLAMVMQSIRMQGYTMRDYLDRIPEAFAALLKARNEGKLVYREHIVEGIEKFPEAIDMLFSGANHGKLMLKVGA